MYKSVYISDRITLEESGMYHVQDMHDMGTLLISKNPCNIDYHFKEANEILTIVIKIL